MKSPIFTCLVWLLLLVFITNATIMPPKKGKRKANTESKKWRINVGPVEQSVFVRDLLSEQPTVKEIIEEGNTYWQNTSARRFNGQTLGFVTPWNNHGYDVAKTFGHKFDTISPVWLRIVYTDKSEFEPFQFAGTHDIDENWIHDVRRTARSGGRSKFSDLDFPFELIRIVE